MLSPRSDSEFKAISPYLNVLGLPPGQVPSLQRFKIKYRTLLKANHPDKVGNNEEVKAITQAARIVFIYLTDHPDKVPKEGTEEQIATDDEHLKVFEAENDLKYNKGCVTFHIDKTECKAWLAALQTHLKVKGIYTKTQDSYQLRTDVWDGIGRCKKGGKKDIPEGSVSVTIFFSKGTVMVQGSLYMAFVALGLCKVADLVRHPGHAAAIMVSSGDEKSDDEDTTTTPNRLVEKETKTADVKSAEKSTKTVESEKVDTAPIENAATQELIAKEDSSTGSTSEEDTSTKVKSASPKQPEKLETVQPEKESTEKVGKVVPEKPDETKQTKKLDSVEPTKEVKTPLRKGRPPKVVSVRKSMKKQPPPKPTKQSNGKDKGDQDKSEVEMKDSVVNDTINNIQDAMLAMRSDFNTALETTNKLQLKTQEDVLDMKSLLVTVSNDLKLLETGGWKPPVKGVKGVTALSHDWSDDPDLPPGWMLNRFESLDSVTKAIESKVETLKVDLETINNSTNNLKSNVDIMIGDIKVNSNAIAKGIKVQNEALEILKNKVEKELLKDNVKEAEITEKATEQVKESMIKSGKDKGVIFTSSIGKGMDVERLEMATNSEIKIVTTYTLEKHEKTKDPDLHLLNMIEEHVNRDMSFVVIGVGTNDITALDNMWPDKKEVLEQCQYQSTFLINTAETIINQYNLDVYILEQPPRYDEPHKDKYGNWAKYSKIANSHLAILATGNPRIHLVENSNLARLPGKGREDLFQKDGLHLTQKGVYTLETNLILAIHQERPDLSTLEVHKKKIPPKPSQGMEGKVKPNKAGPALSSQPGGSQKFPLPPPCTARVQEGVKLHQQYTPEYQQQKSFQQQQQFGHQQQFGQQQSGQQQQFGQQQSGQHQFGQQQQFGQQRPFGQQQFGQQQWGPQHGYDYSYPQHWNSSQWQQQGGW